MATFMTRKPEPARAQAAEAAAPVQAAPQAAAQTAPQTDSVIGSGLVIEGNVTSRGDIKVDGVIKGDVDCAALTISENGSVEGGINAQQVTVHGEAKGSIRGRSVMLHKTARVEADVKHQGIGIEMGTRYDGALHWAEDAEFEKASEKAASNVEALAS